MTKVLPESDNAELAGLNPAHVGDHIAHGRSHSGARRPSCGDDWANIHAGSARQLLPATVPVSKSTGDPHEQVGFNCFCRGPRASHNWRAGHAAGGNRCVQWRGDHPGCTRLRPGWTSRPLRPLSAALRLPARLAQRPLRRPLLPQSLVLIDGAERADEALIRPCLRGLAMARGWLALHAQEGSAGPFANPRGPRAVGIPDYREQSVSGRAKAGPARSDLCRGARILSRGARRSFSG
jgi:hypothetical protein